MSITKFYVSTDVPATQDAEGYEALAYTEVGSTEDQALGQSHPCQGGCEACVGCNVPENSI